MKLIYTIWLVTTALTATCILGCANGGADEKKNDSEGYQPKGDKSDLVYNPIKSDGSIDSSYLPILAWDEEVYDFGVIDKGKVVTKEFSFSNAGTAPLLISSGTSNCGCTVPEWPKEVIPPGGKGVIVVKFDSTNKEGSQNKQVTIFANTIPNRNVITIKGVVQ